MSIKYLWSSCKHFFCEDSDEHFGVFAIRVTLSRKTASLREGKKKR